ncbi:RRP12 [Mytilus coruscus]|uniref:RRP12 n=1 Tax=Mytilus coruscus TaxID=42192 RepID=A0A6J8F1P0_MYTCO|nr:unnamed protein product [Mytilus coruscus]CAC5426031.1 unnamed protein product [Mytilus coruscus]CAC5426032.1 RRP12 [Mytilus coruscus]
MGSKSKLIKRISKSATKTKWKGKRWKKGKSSSSNPDTKRFRDAAKTRFFQPMSSAGTSGLTVDALAKHDEDHFSKDTDSLQEGFEKLSTSDKISVGAKTFNTWATNYTECTNVTFNKVHRYWSSNSALHKEVIAILAAVTEVIKTNDGNETETEYFAALMTALDTTDDVESQAAIMYLLSLVIKRVPVAVLRSKFAEVSKKFLDLLAANVDGSSTALVKSLLLSLAGVLRVQDQASWSNTSVQRVYSGLLTFITHKKPKIRKAAQQGVCLVLRGSLFMTQGDSPSYHPAAQITAKYCIQQIEQCGGTGEALDTLHTLALLKDILAQFPLNSMKSCCETILRMMTLSNVMVTSCGMQTLYGMFVNKPKPSNLSAELNAQLITAMYDYQPSENDVQPMRAWLAVMEKGHINLTRLDEKLCISHLPRLFSSTMTCLLSDKTDINSAAAKTMKDVLKECVTPVADSVKHLVDTAPSGSATPIHKMVKAVESGLSYQFHSVWGLVLQIYTVFFEVLGKQCPKLFKKSLQSIVDLRDSPRFAYKAELDHAIGCAVRYMGPRQVLEAVPLNITGDNDDYNFPRSWMIPVIRDNVCNTELGFFTSYFLPLAAKFRQRALEATQTDNIVVGKSYETLQHQMWTLLPGFCNKPTDLVQSFKGIAKILGTAINDHSNLRMEVMSSLRKIINHSMIEEESKTEVAKFAKNFLPILFNIFTADSDNTKDPVKLAVLETIKCYLQIADMNLVSTFCDKCTEKLKEENITASKRHSLLDIAITELPYIDDKRIKQLYSIACSYLQKKSSEFSSKAVRGKSAGCKTFISQNLSDIQSTLLTSLSSSSPSSKAPRLRCLINLFQQFDTEQPDFMLAVIPEGDFMLAVIPEAILCTREVGERARTAAYSLLVQMCKSQIEQSDESQADVICKYFKMILAGLGGSPQMVSCTLLALTRILYEFKDSIDGNLLGNIIESVCLLLTSKAREVVKSSLAFIKVLLSAYQDVQLASHLKQIMSSLTSMKDDCRQHFRFKAKEIYAKLIKKFGYETIYNMAPSSIHKVLMNVRKTQERNKKKKKEEKTEEDEDSDEEHRKARPESVEELLRDSDSEMEDDDNKKSRGQKSKKNKDSIKAKLAWLQEGADDIVDFLDTNASKKVMATRPQEKSDANKAKKSKERQYKTASDGRLIITEDSSDEEKRKGQSQMSEDEDLEDLFQAIEGIGNKRSKKRKIEDLGSDDESARPKYKTGGKGIHRPIGESDYGKEYRAKKAKGDIKKKGKPDPYAYVPLQFQSLNKRKKAKMQGQFKNLVKGAKKGAMKGTKKKHKK